MGQSWRVPNATRSVLEADNDERIPKLLASGTYVGKILDIGEPKLSKTGVGYFHLRITVEIEGRMFFAYIAGYLSICVMVYRARRRWLDTEQMCKVSVTEWQDEEFNRVDILWAVEGDDDTPTAT